ncbi:hypothetical protein C1646_671388 [Rhizophagus diaphanus]|nr:hypothetical protein C1646_671388 [Rhizophagus diaphanus] [Rhizophagus sp. MUCL 43196]
MEKNYIYEWVNSQKDRDVIRWEILQRDIQEIFGIFRLRNDLKYQWNHGEKNYVYEWVIRQQKNFMGNLQRDIQVDYEKMIYLNYLEPLISQCPFSDMEKDYIYEWVNSQKDRDVIRWEFLQREIQETFGTFRLRHDLKYQWNCRRRQSSRWRNTGYLSTLHEDDERTPQYNLASAKLIKTHSQIVRKTTFMSG